MIYARADDADGASWTEINIPADGSNTGIGLWTSLEVVNGYPAISYHDLTNSTLKYLIAADINGQTWNLSRTIDIGVAAGGTYTSLTTIDGFAAIGYYENVGKDLEFALLIE